VDLMIALDVSASMRAQDVAPNRLERAKNEIKKLLDDLTGDRVGLVVFAGDAFVQCPLTTDYDAVRLFLDVAEPEQIATPGTNFRAAVRTAVRAFEASAEAGGRPQPTNPGPEGADPPAPDPRSRALLVVSDGENHVGDLSGIQQTAREAGVRLFAAGVGETGGARIPRLDDGRVVGYKRDRSGQVVRTRLEEDALRRLSADGAYFRIARTSSALADLRAALAQMEQTAFDAERFEEYENVYQWPLALALLLLAADPLVRTRRRQQGEDKG
jgi:Ca-activated chloride channel family protein